MTRKLVLLSLLLLGSACGDSSSTEQAPVATAVAEGTLPVLPSPSIATPTTIAPPSSMEEPSRTEAAPSRVEAPRPIVAGRSLLRLTTAHAVESREPKDEAVSFIVGERAYAFLELRNEPREAGSVTVTFERAGARQTPRPLALEHGATPTFRTWAYTTPRQPGHYEAIVRTSDGEELGRASFDVVAAP